MKNQKNNHNNKLQGVISITSKGTGYVATGGEKNKQDKQDIEVDFKNLNTAMHGDIVEILLHPKGKERQTAEVSKIINRAKIRFTGVLEQENLEVLPPSGGRTSKFFGKTKVAVSFFSL